MLDYQKKKRFPSHESLRNIVLTGTLGPQMLSISAFTYILLYQDTSPCYSLILFFAALTGTLPLCDLISCTFTRTLGYQKSHSDS